MTARTQVAIIGSGPAGLMLAQLLHLNDIDSVLLERSSEDHVIERVRAGVLEQGTVDLINAAKVGARLAKEGLRHDGVYLAFNGERHHIDFRKLTGKSIFVYGQNEVVKDFIGARVASGRALHFNVSNVAVEQLTGSNPKVTYNKDGMRQELVCDFVAGCDGFHGICRAAIPADKLHRYEKVYPFGWLGILAHAPPTSEELVYALHERGFALYSMRSPQVTRLYLQCTPDENIEEWPDSRIWDELHLRLRTSDGWRIQEGEIFQKGVTPMRSFVADPMRYGNLFLAGDAAHIVPPTGAKGLNLAAGDIRVLAHALVTFYRSGQTQEMDNYSQTCLRRIWKAQRFSWWMTSMLHRFSREDDFDYRRQLAELDYVTGSQAGMTSLAENYVGLRIDTPLVAPSLAT